MLPGCVLLVAAVCEDSQLEKTFIQKPDQEQNPVPQNDACIPLPGSLYLLILPLPPPNNRQQTTRTKSNVLSFPTGEPPHEIPEPLVIRSFTLTSAR